MNNYINNQNDLFQIEEGFLIGNLWRNLYDPYKNYMESRLVPKNEKEKCLYELSIVSFAAHELNLYLDIHPEDKSMFMLFVDYQKKANRLMEEYEEKYGPLCINSESMNESYAWVNNWPWEVTNV